MAVRLVPAAATAGLRLGRRVRPGYFMYFEDVDLGERLADAGWLNVYAPSAEIVHTGSHATSRNKQAMFVEHPGFQQHPQWRAAPQQMILSYNLVDRAGPHALRKGQHGIPRCRHRAHLRVAAPSTTSTPLGGAKWNCASSTFLLTDALRTHFAWCRRADRRTSCAPARRRERQLDRLEVAVRDFGLSDHVQPSFMPRPRGRMRRTASICCESSSAGVRRALPPPAAR